MYTNTPQDPRNPAPNFSSPYAPWAVDLFNIRPRHRLRLQLHFRYERPEPDRRRRRTFVEENNNTLYNAIHTISIIRRFLLINAQGMENQYGGIRVMLWRHDYTIEYSNSTRRPVEALVECDDQYLETMGGIRDTIVSRLQDRTFDRPGQPRQPDHNYMATEHPPPYVQPMPPPPVPGPPPRGLGDDEEDEADPSILGP